MKYVIITTFNDDGYHKYGKRMLNTFNKYWPNDVEIHAYYEGSKPADNISDRVYYHDLIESCPDLVDFKEKYKNDPIASGAPEDQGIPGGVIRPIDIKPKWKGAQSFLWDAIRFSHKTFCVNHATRNIDADVVYWMDADTITFRDITKKVYSKWLPDNCYISFLGRITYTECGFVAYNVRHPYHNEFMDRWIDLYNTGKLFNLREWHDCISFDKIRVEMEKEGKIINNNLNEDNQIRGHPFINSVLGEYIDHLKGKRKNSQRSWVQDIENENIKKVDYWKNHIESKVQK